jgi:ABC-type transport system substrate-binding protein
MTLLLAMSCSSQPNPSATAVTSPGPNPTPRYADTLRIAGPVNRNLGMSNVSFGFPLAPATLVYNALYRWDSTFGVLPDLADGPCAISDDGTVIRCHLIDAMFQDGTPVTADDVVYSYLLQKSPRCRTEQGAALYPGQTAFSGAPCFGQLGTSALRSAAAIDPHTVELRLFARDPTFVTSILPAIGILPRHLIETSYADLIGVAQGLKAADLRSLAGAVWDEANRDPPICTAHVEQLKGLMERLGVAWSPEDFQGDTGFDPCGFSGWAADVLSSSAPGSSIEGGIAAALELTGVDAVAAVYPYLSFNWHPVGSGPYRFVSWSADTLELEASPTYFGPGPATRFLHFQRPVGDAGDLIAGSVDIASAIIDPTRALAAPGVLVAAAPTPSYVALHYNVRSGHLFADLNLRRALQLCIDKERDVDAATRGQEDPAYGPYMPGGWAYDPTLPKPGRDVAAARRLIEVSGWRAGPDGVYTRGKLRLSAQIVVRGDQVQRTKMADLIALQAADCGMELTVDPVRFGSDIFTMIENYPHDIPGTTRPFDLYLGAWGSFPDPGQSSGQWQSTTITSTVRPDGSSNNMIGFADATVDRLLAAAMNTNDQAERARLYRQLQQELAAQQPMLFLWTFRAYAAVSARVVSVGEPLDLGAPDWYWQPEKLALLVASP